MILAATAWHTNADMVLDLRTLGYLNPEDRILDPTYGKGIWWKKWKPAKLVVSAHDFTKLPYASNVFDVATFDPPYVSKGGRKTSGIIEVMDDRYGQVDCPATPQLLQDLINDGLREMNRVVRHRGLVLVKCKDYISSGKLFPGTHHTLCTALELGMRYKDRFEHLSGVGPQPPGRRQIHARRNFSTLLVLEVRK
jgi:tRNA G10  N-methylase Trm11